MADLADPDALDLLTKVVSLLREARRDGWKFQLQQWGEDRFQLDLWREPAPPASGDVGSSNPPRVT